MRNYRIFVSHSTDDVDLAECLSRRLKKLGAQPILASHKLVPGEDFLTGIKELIRHSHALVPILTKYSQTRPWVNHEIGFAVATNMPMLPISVGVSPEGLTEATHALRFETRSEFALKLRKLLKRKDIEAIFRPQSTLDSPIYECARTPDDRNRFLTDYLRRLPGYGTEKLRQLSAFGSFSIPDADPREEVWRLREGSKPREGARKLLRKERVRLEQHARRVGCRLMIKPSVRASAHGEFGTKTRLSLMRDFLLGMEGSDIDVAVLPPKPKMLMSRTIVGDWFVADAVVPFRGRSYYNTIFSRHAPTVLSNIRDFDDYFRSVRRQNKKENGEVSSRKFAIEKINRAIKSLG